MRVVEIDFSFSYLIYFLCVELTAFHEFASICATIMVVNTFLLTFAHLLPTETEADRTKAQGAKLILKLVNVATTIIGFF